MKISDFRIHSTDKLDDILAKCCELIIKKQKQDSEEWGMVAACVLDMNNRAVYGVNYKMDDGTRKHAERAAIDNYREKYGDNLEHCIVITTLSPCSEPMSERHGDSCTNLINEVGIHKVYCGYKDPSQEHSEHYKHKHFHVKCTRNEKLNELCKRFADTFLNSDDSDDSVLKESFPGKNKNAIYNLLVKTIGSGPFDGGCVIFARALQMRWGGEIVALVGHAQRSVSNEPSSAQHAALLIGNRLIDADGMATADEFIRRFERNELLHAGGKITGVRNLHDSDLSEAPRNEELSAKIAKLLKPK